MMFFVGSSFFISNFFERGDHFHHFFMRGGVLFVGGGLEY